MKKSIQSFFLILLAVPQLLWADPDVSTRNSDLLDKIWEIGKSQACSPDQRFRFNEFSLTALKASLTDQNDIEALARILNPFFKSMPRTQLLTPKSELYHFVKGRFSDLNPWLPKPPQMPNPGVRVGSDENGFYARYVLDGSNAVSIGIKQGDRILEVNGKPFAGSWEDEGAESPAIKFQRGNEISEVLTYFPKRTPYDESHIATLESVQVVRDQGSDVGFIRLWNGMHTKSAVALSAAAKRFNKEQVKGAILDLRGTFGGDHWEYLDAFFADRTQYFELSSTNGDGTTTTTKATPQKNPNAYLGPLVVLIDENTRGPAEAMAYQFQKSKRATVIGMKSAGVYSITQDYFLDIWSDYVFQLCVQHDVKVDSTLIDGVGIQPDLAVPFAIVDGQDTQEQAAFNELERHF